MVREMSPVRLTDAVCSRNARRVRTVDFRSYIPTAHHARARKHGSPACETHRLDCLRLPLVLSANMAPTFLGDSAPAFRQRVGTILLLTAIAVAGADASGMSRLRPLALENGLRRPLSREARDSSRKLNLPRLGKFEQQGSQCPAGQKEVHLVEAGERFVQHGQSRE
jgi:hypothetical protein